MGKPFVVLDAELLNSSVWAEAAHVKLVWITLLLLCDTEGYVAAALPGVARAAGVSLAECEDAFARLMAPDPHSRTKANEGRRLAVADRGFTILNFVALVERRALARAKSAERTRRWRERRPVGDASRGVTAVTDRHGDAFSNVTVTPCDGDVTQGGVRSKEGGVRREDERTARQPGSPAGSEPDQSERSLEREELRRVRTDVSAELGRVLDLLGPTGDGQREMRRASLAPGGQCIVNPAACTSLPWLRTTLDRLVTRRLELEEQRAESAPRCSGETPLARIKRMERGEMAHAATGRRATEGGEA